MASLTPAIDALYQNTSVNALVRSFLESYVDAKSWHLEALARFEQIAASANSASDQPWSRDSLHERR
jgi:hypothetical protein